MSAVKFKDLPIGATFEFRHADDMTRRALASGPWRKFAYRSYCKASDAPGAESRYRVGSINAAVVLLSDDNATAFRDMGCTLAPTDHN
jgi:hypothetical protein